MAGVVDKVRELLSGRMVRTGELFRDHDPLRTGFVTASQFQRAIVARIGTVLAQADFDALAAHYNTKADGRVNYRLFEDAMDHAIIPSNLERLPTAPIPSPSRPIDRNQLPDQLEQEFALVFAKLQHHCKVNGIDIKACYEPFDLHHNGKVTRSQFLRAFPGPASVTQYDKELVISKYASGSLDVNYLQFFRDIESVASEPAISRTWRFTQRDVSLTKREFSPQVSEVVERLRVGFFRSRVRPLDFFADHDKLRSGLVTENQFICGLSLACSARDGANLTRDELQLIASEFSNGAGHVKYRDFCQITDKSYLTGYSVDLERMPTVTPKSLTREDISFATSTLTAQEEQDIEGVLSTIEEHVFRTGSDLYAFFRDYNSIYGMTQTVTNSQFQRLVDFLGIKFTPYEIKLLTKKFSDSRNGEVNFRAFLARVDSKTRLQLPSDFYYDPLPAAQQHLATLKIREQNAHTQLQIEDYDKVLRKVQQKAMRDRVRVGVFFLDFDGLRTGFVPQSKFESTLNTLGFGLSPSEVRALVAHYGVVRQGANDVHWKAFERDIESVFTQLDAQSSPTKGYDGLSNTLSRLDASLAVPHDERLDPDLVAEATTLLDRLQVIASQRTANLEFFFRDFDRPNAGFVSATQFQQGLQFGQFNLVEREMQLLTAFFTEPKGVNYRDFLSRVIPPPSIEKLHETTIMTSRRAATVKAAHLLETKRRAPNIEDLLLKIKSQVVRERIRISEFMQDFDKLRSGRITESIFHRALEQCGIHLSDAEKDVLIRHFRSDREGYVNYPAFSDACEASFTAKGLERNPEATPVPFAPPLALEIAAQTRKLADEDEINQLLVNFAAILRTRRLLIKPEFQDFDSHHRGCVSSSQFRRVLHELSLDQGIREPLVQALVKKYTVPLGGRNDVQYSIFCDDLASISDLQHQALTA
eukprot:m.288100 g.288100  ORF g.288100 m.288100 type:complete len:928 (-) comp55034_c0_seq1:99-2882(-)